jgi:glycosyltransferase involved in cell wall biosynthesis
MEDNNIKQDKPFFSIVICAYNRAKILPRALSSLLDQEFKDFEVLLVDDGSDDDIYSVYKNFRKKLPSLRYMYQNHKGLPKARNLGISSSKGRYITFLDSDDSYESNHLKSRYELLTAHPEVELLYGGVRVVGNPFVPDLNNPGEMILIEKCIVGGTFFFTKDLSRKLNGFRDLKYGDDTDFFMRAKELGANILKTKINTYIYIRDQEDSICNNQNTK